MIHPLTASKRGAASSSTFRNSDQVQQLVTTGQAKLLQTKFNCSRQDKHATWVLQTTKYWFIRLLLQQTKNTTLSFGHWSLPHCRSPSLIRYFPRLLRRLHPSLSSPSFLQRWENGQDEKMIISRETKCSYHGCTTKTA